MFPVICGFCFFVVCLLFVCLLCVFFGFAVVAPPLFVFVFSVSFVRLFAWVGLHVRFLIFFWLLSPRRRGSPKQGRRTGQVVLYLYRRGLHQHGAPCAPCPFPHPPPPVCFVPPLFLLFVFASVCSSFPRCVCLSFPLLCFRFCLARFCFVVFVGFLFLLVLLSFSGRALYVCYVCSLS